MTLAPLLRATFCLLCVSYLCSVEAFADARLPHIFTDNMVLQRDQTVPVWGWADPGEQVTVAFADQSKLATADHSGSWRVEFDSLSTSDQPRVLTVTAGNEIQIKNVVVGEVWVCSGQSNMESFH